MPYWTWSSTAEFYYDGIIPSVGLTLLAGLPKTGKSWLALNFAKHMDGTIPVHYLAAKKRAQA